MNIENIILKHAPNVYLPEEDTFTLASALDQWFNEHRPLVPLKILEVGCGPGFLIIRLAKKHPQHLYFASDVSWEACIHASQNAKINGVLVYISCQNLVKGFIGQAQGGEFNLVFFNPPYLPSDSINQPMHPLDIATLGGLGGIEIIKQFLQEIPKVLAEDGQVLLLTTNWNPQEQVREMARQHFRQVIPYYQRKILSERHIVYLLKK